MIEFYEGLNGLEKVFLFCGLIGGIVFLIRTVMMLLGTDSDSDIDIDADMDMDIDLDMDGNADIDIDVDSGEGVPDTSDASFRLLSLHTISAFILIFGIMGLAMSVQAQAGDGLSLLVAVLAGFFSMYIIARIMSWMRTLQSSGSIQMKNAIGQEGTVYLGIPADGQGKVRVAIQNNLKVWPAISADKTAIPTDTNIRVVKVVSGNVLVVETAAEQKGERS